MDTVEGRSKQVFKTAAAEELPDAAVVMGPLPRGQTSPATRSSRPSTAGSSTPADPPPDSATQPATSPDVCSSPEGSDRNYTPDCEEAVCPRVSAGKDASGCAIAHSSSFARCQLLGAGGSRFAILPASQKASSR